MNIEHLDQINIFSCYFVWDMHFLRHFHRAELKIGIYDVTRITQAIYLCVENSVCYDMISMHLVQLWL